MALNLGLSRLSLGGGGAGAAFTISLTNLTSGEARNGDVIGVSISPALGGGETVTYQWTDNGTPVGPATSSTFTPNIGTNMTDGQTLRCEVTIDGETFTSNGAPARYAPGTFGALSNQSFSDDSGDQTYVFPAATGTGLTWTYALTSPPAGVSIVSATRTITHDTDAMAVQAGTVITVTTTDQYGRAATGSPRTYELTIAASVNPVFNTLTFADQTNANDTLTASYTYAGADTLQLIFVTRNGGTALSAAQLKAGTGTFLERVVIDPFSTSTIDVTSQLTATSEAATAIDAIIVEKNNGGESAVVTETVSGIDVTAPTFSSAATDSVDGTEITIDLSEAVAFPGSAPATSDFTLSGVAAGSTIDSVSIVGGDIVLDITTNPAVSTDTITIAYAKGANVIVDGDGNELASFTAQSVTNNVPSASGITLVDGAWTTAEIPSGAGTTNVNFPATALENDIAIIIRACDAALTSVATTGATVIFAGSGDAPGTRVEYIVLGATPGTSVEVAQTSAEQACIVGLLRGANTTTVQDATRTVTSGTSASVTPPAIMTVTDGAWVFACAFLDDDAGATVSAYPSGYTNTVAYNTPTPGANAAATVAVATKEVATAGTETPGSYTFSSDDGVVGLTFAIRPA